MNRKDIFTKLVFSIIVISILFFFFTKILIYMKDSTYANADKKIKKLSIEKKRLESLEKKLSDYKNFGSKYNEFKKKYFLRYDEFNVFRKNLQQLKAKYEFLNSSFNFSGKVILKEFIKIPLTIKLEGQYSELKKFIHDISKMKNFIYISSIKLQKMKTNISGAFTMEVYFVR